MDSPKSRSRPQQQAHRSHGLPDHEINVAEGLTSIHQRIHYTATPDTTDGNDELDQIQIDNFLNTLAQIALSIARRKEMLDR